MKPTLQNSDCVKDQYKNAESLQARISLHQKYSVNKQRFAPWIFQQYSIEKNFHILELGCGDGSMWKEALPQLPCGVSLVLTDFSEGMLRTARDTLWKNDRVSFQQVDIQRIPFADHSFDMVIANMMLYHVPDLKKALSEVKRVLHPAGSFYCATYGQTGIVEYVQSLLPDYEVKNNANKVFTLQNGKEILSPYFSCVTRCLYEDHLEVTCTEDLVDYIFSLGSMTDFTMVPREVLKARLEKQKIDGKIYVPKEYGLFIAKNPDPSL